jgi:NDP-sugar pyrophosphorylase family protein
VAKVKAMILAAGLGTRLRPLTDDRPKALVEVAGRTLLEIALTRLRSFGVNEVIVNTHHFADRMAEYLRAHDNFGMRVEISREEELLDTGGGLKKAAWFFLDGRNSEGRNSDGGEQGAPFLLHNVDVISSVDLGAMVCAHVAQGALATLAVMERESSRQLLFDAQGHLCGRRVNDSDEVTCSAQTMKPLAFSGIHVLSSRIFGELREQGAFSIIDAYLRLAAQGEIIAAYRSDGCYWRDLGKPASLEQAAHDFAEGKFS